MGRFSNAELRKFRDTSRCSACVHYCGCQLWLALLLMNDELTAPDWRREADRIYELRFGTAGGL